jgi:hypothetical protein
VRAGGSPRRAALAAIAAIAVALAGSAACAGESPSVDAVSDADTTIADASVDSSDSAGLPAGSRGESEAVRDHAPVTGLENFEVPADPRLTSVPETVKVEIENISSASVVVSARAGAGTVLLDTLRAGRRFRVDLVGPPGAIELVWMARNASLSGVVPVPVPVAGDTVLRLTVGVPAAP